MNWIVHIIFLILGEIWSKGGNLTGLLLANVSAEVAEVNLKALNIKSYQPGEKNCWGSAKAKCIFIMLPRHFICHSKKCWNLRAAPHALPLSTIWKNLQKGLFAYSKLNSTFPLKIFFWGQYHDIKNALIYKVNCKLKMT